MATDLAAGTPMPSGYLQMACAVWYLYDSVLTLDDEVKYIWGRRRSFSKGLFFLIRLTTVGVLAADTVLCIFIENLSESLRVWVLYQKSRRVLWINGGLFIVNLLIAVGRLYSQEHFAPVPAYVQGACFDVRPALSGPSLCYEIHLTLMMVYKLARDRRLREHLDGPSLISTLVRDSVVYFFL
ncbi:hypothetical protein EXIGLDRAFT_701126 [Exidia glandulosa HHB12029]|uniref:DUF6533 domain-containing protein n=1 Tax=Exidia glandulosa HHB12029 TaxID=1314781 RepID=A0A165D370_EXIGL|nr:hypothetical protein EXIGLDRAFT_701126 [Exidia glandulosa HHB12029]